MLQLAGKLIDIIVLILILLVMLSNPVLAGRTKNGLIMAMLLLLSPERILFSFSHY